MSDGRGAGSVNLLMYHSISREPGPTSIAPETFAGQLDALADCGCRVVPLEAVAAWLAGEAALPDRAVAITFDDGFADFAEVAAPLIEAKGWSATVFLPSGKMGTHEDWEGANRDPARGLMDWDQVRDWAARGMDFGSHSITHADLTRLAPAELERQVRRSGEAIGEELGRAPVTFAPPYGHSNAAVRREIARWYKLSVGTRLGRATARSDRYDLPRIEMYYFQDLARWRSYLEGRSEWYLQARRGLRRIRQFSLRGPA